MQAYFIRYRTPNSSTDWNAHIDAKDTASAKRKLERKLGEKVSIQEIKIIGYY